MVEFVANFKPPKVTHEINESCGVTGEFVFFSILALFQVVRAPLPLVRGA